MNIVDYIKGMTSTLQKDKWLEELQTNITALDTVVNPSTRSFIKTLPTFSSVPKQLKEYQTKMKSRHNKSHSRLSIYNLLLADLNNIRDNADTLSKYVEDNFGKVIMKRSMTIRHLNVAAATKQLTFVVEFMMEFLDIALNLLCVEEGSDAEYHLASKRRFIALESNLYQFIGVVNVLAVDVDQFKEDIKDIPDLLVTANNEDIMLGRSDTETFITPSNPSLNNFTGVNLFFLRNFKADRQTARYSLLKNRKKVLEYKLEAAKLTQQGQNSPMLERTISVLEERIDADTYKMAKIMGAD